MIYFMIINVNILRILRKTRLFEKDGSQARLALLRLDG
jgi:hypothetical protein